MAEKYYSHDITFCSFDKCTHRSCERHKCNSKYEFYPYTSFADFSKKCPILKKKGDDNG